MTNPIVESCLERELDKEYHAKFAQVLGYLGEKCTSHLFRTYNQGLRARISSLARCQFPSGYTLETHVGSMIQYYSFRFIANIGQHLISKHLEGDKKAEENVILLIKVLLHHGLLSKDITANFALVELEQMCRACKLSLPELYQCYRTKFLRLIITGILKKLTGNGDKCRCFTNGNATGLSQFRHNCVTAYMTRAFEIFEVNMITSDDIAQSLIIITNLIQKDKYTIAIGQFLDHLATHQKIDTFTMIRAHIETILVTLLLRRKMSQFDISESLRKLCLFFQKKPDDVLATKFTSLKGKLLLHYSVNPKLVTDAIYYLSTFEKNLMDQPFEDEFEDETTFVEYLKPALVGILLGVDAHFTSIAKDLGSSASIDNISSLGKLISMLDQDQIRTIHHKLLSTLSLIVRLRPTRTDQALNSAVIALWKEFMKKLESSLKDSLLINICIALHDLIIDSPAEVSVIFVDLFSLLQQQFPRVGSPNNGRANSTGEDKLSEKLKCLFFIPNQDGFETVFKYLTPYVHREIVASDIQDLYRALESVLPLLRYENQKCHKIAVARIREILKSNQQLITSSMLVNSDEPLNKTISQTIQSLLAVSSTLDSELSSDIARCLGTLGAVNPIRLENFIYGGSSDKRARVMSLSDDGFIIGLIERLKNSLFSDRISESESANFALQVVVETYDILEKTIKKSLSAEAVRACELCKDTNYKGTQRTMPDPKMPIYQRFKSENQYSYKEWLDKFSLLLISVLEDSKAQEVLHACTYTFKNNVKMAEFILPMVITHIILNQPDNTGIIEREIMAIVTEDVGLSSQDMDNVYQDDVMSNLHTLHFQCANMIFCVLDALTNLERYLVSANLKEAIHDVDQINSVRRFNASIPKNKLAMLSSNCRAYTRALYYFDLYYFEKKHWPIPGIEKPPIDEFDSYWTDLQKVFMALDESFEAAGVENVRSSHTTLRDDIANCEALGKFDRAYVCYEALLDGLDERVDKKSFFEDSLHCLSKRGDYQRLYERSQQLLAKYPQYKRSLLPSAIEALWKLGKWDELTRTLKTEDMDSLLESSPVSQGYLLVSLNESRRTVPQRLQIVEGCLMKPLSIAMIDRSAYFRGYRNLLVLHQIEDFALTLEMLEQNHVDSQNQNENTVDRVRSNLIKSLKILFQTWNKRNKLVEPTIRSLEPLISWQRSIVQTLVKKYPCLQPKVSVDLGQMWLMSANVARQACCYDRSFHCVTQAQKYLEPDLLKTNLELCVKLTSEQAQLEWDQGESTKAIQKLKNTLHKLRGHDLYKHLESRKFIFEESRRKINEISAEEQYPDLSGRLCEDCEKFCSSDRESFAKLMILLTRYSGDAAAGTPKTLLSMYEQCVHLGVHQEEILLLLARYYDKLASYYSENPNTLKLPEHLDSNEHRSSSRKSLSQEKLNRQNAYREDIITKLMEQSILAFGNSMKWGLKHLEESMPRMLNIWLDLGSKKGGSPTQLDDNVSSRKSISSPPRSISTRIENTIRFIDGLLPRKDGCNKGLPSFYYLPALSLLLSRAHHSHSGVCEKTIKILEQLTIDYPHQMTWRLMALINDPLKERRNAADKIIKGATRRENRILKIIDDNKSLATVMERICVRVTPYDSKDGLDKESTREAKLALDRLTLSHLKIQTKLMKFSEMTAIVPTLMSMRPVYPTESDCRALEKHNLFPEHNMTYISEIEPRLKVFRSLQAPKQVNIRCRNGLKLNILCKAGDDLRKDSRCIEFFQLINKILRHSAQSSAKFFEIASYLVLPLQNQAGIIEMVPNCVTFRTVVHEGYQRQKGKNFNISDCGLKKRVKKLDVSDYTLYRHFIKDILPRVTPPVFQDALKSKFVEPTSWYMARTAYIRSTAAISMGGYIIGLGDRHTDNMLLDVSQGRIVHVDFNLVFHQGESLQIPEIVPFRLTRNVASGFGPMETEGNFRRFCEIAMRVMRSERELLLTALKPFLHDPCVDWQKSRTNNALRLEEQEGNQTAKDRIKVVEDKLKGFPRSSIHRPLNAFNSHSVESQVDILIDEATDIYNISIMYFGWAPQI